MLKKLVPCYRHPDFEIQFFSNLSSSCLPPCVLQRGRNRHIIGKRNIWSKNRDEGNKNIYFFVDGFAVWRLSRNQFTPVWAEIVKNYPAWKQELLSPKNMYIGHQVSIWKIMGKTIIKESLLVTILVRALESNFSFNFAKMFLPYNCLMSNKKFI